MRNMGPTDISIIIEAPYNEPKVLQSVAFTKPGPVDEVDFKWIQGIEITTLTKLVEPKTTSSHTPTTQNKLQTSS